MTRGFLRALSVFLALLCLYLLSIPLGLINLEGLRKHSPWFGVPSIVPYGLGWPDTAVLVTVLVYHLVAAVYTMSITLALCGMLQIEGTERRVRGAIAADGLGSVIAVLFGGVPLISYDQNVGAISLTGVGSRFVVATAGAISISNGTHAKGRGANCDRPTICAGWDAHFYVRNDWRRGRRHTCE